MLIDMKLVHKKKRKLLRNWGDKQEQKTRTRETLESISVLSINSVFSFSLFLTPNKLFQIQFLIFFDWGLSHFYPSLSSSGLVHHTAADASTIQISFSSQHLFIYLEPKSYQGTDISIPIFWNAENNFLDDFQTSFPLRKVKNLFLYRMWQLLRIWIIAKEILVKKLIVMHFWKGLTFYYSKPVESFSKYSALKFLIESFKVESKAGVSFKIWLKWKKMWDYLEKHREIWKEVQFRKMLRRKSYFLRGFSLFSRYSMYMEKVE